MLSREGISPAVTRRQSFWALLGCASVLGMSSPLTAAQLEGDSKNVNGASPWLTLPPTPTMPVPTRQGLVPLNGVKVFYAQFGQGPSILLLHGGDANSNYWSHQIVDLSKNFSVTVMDTRGQGRSPLTSDKLGYETFARDVVALMDFLEISRTTIVGWSDGAITGLQLALTQPRRLNGLFAFGANSNLGGLKPGGARSGVFPSYSLRCRKEYSELSPDPGKWGELQRGLAKMWRSEPNFSNALLGTIKLPVVIADGEYDEIIKPEHTRQIAESIKESRLVILKRVSHFAMLQDPPQFNQAVQKFLLGAS